MPERPTIRVTQDLIDGAKPEDSSHCMIAEALKVALPNAVQVSVDLATIRYSDRKRRKRYMILTPPIAQRNLLMFDQADPELKPFEFRLPPPAQIVRMPERKKPEPVPAKRDTSTPKRAQAASAKRDTRSPKKTARSVPEPVEPAPKKRQKATLGYAKGGSRPPKVGGSLPPLGPLAGGQAGKVTGEAAKRQKFTTGRIRAYGIRVMGQ